MNWVCLYLIFNLALGLSFCKLHYLFKEKELIRSEETLSYMKTYFSQIK